MYAFSNLYIITFIQMLILADYKNYHYGVVLIKVTLYDNDKNDSNKLIHSAIKYISHDTSLLQTPVDQPISHHISLSRKFSLGVFPTLRTVEQ